MAQSPPASTEGRGTLFRLVLIAGFVTALALTVLPSPVAAQTYPPCSPTIDSVVQFADLPDQLVADRVYRFGMSEGNGTGHVSSDTIGVVMSEGAEPFFTGAINPWALEDRLGIRADPGDGPITVTATYVEYQLLPDGALCERTLTRTAQPVVGRAMPKPKVAAPGKRVIFTLAYPAWCERSYAPTPVVLRIKDPASGWVVLRSSDQCKGWDKRRGRGRYFRVQGKPDSQRMLFMPSTPKQNGVMSFRFEVNSSIRTLRRGVIRVTTKHAPATRVYGMHPNGSINDRYWNYCVNNGKTVWMDNGNPYCVVPSSTRRTAVIGR